MTTYEGEVSASELADVLQNSDPSAGVAIEFISPESGREYTNNDHHVYANYHGEYDEQPSPQETADFVTDLYSQGIAFHTLEDPILNADVRPESHIGGDPDDDTLSTNYRAAVRAAPENVVNDHGAGVVAVVYTLDWLDPVDDVDAHEAYLEGDLGLDSTQHP